MKMTISSAEVVEKDLQYICSNLIEEFSSISGRRLLITGGAGFLGYYLVQSVLHWNKQETGLEKIRVTVLDNYIRGVPTWLTMLAGDENLTLVTHDMINPLPENLDDFHYIVHAAGIASPTYYRKYPIETMDANVSGLRVLLEYCRRQGGKRKPVLGFLFFSSSEIYGDPTPENIPTPETYRGNVSCTGPRACYDEAKRFGETLCTNFARHYGLPIKVARPFNNYGPGLKITDGRVLPDFARDILTSQNVRMLSDGSPKRTFCYVADAIIGYYKILVKGRAGEAYNIGVETPEISMAELAERLVRIARDLYDYRGQVIREVSGDGDYLLDNPSRRCPVISKAKAELGYSPAISLDEGLTRLLLWYAQNCNGEER